MNSLLDLSGKVDPLTLGLLATFSEVAGSLAVRFFVSTRIREPKPSPFRGPGNEGLIGGDAVSTLYRVL